MILSLSEQEQGVLRYALRHTLFGAQYLEESDDKEDQMWSEPQMAGQFIEIANKLLKEIYESQ